MNKMLRNTIRIWLFPSILLSGLMVSAQSERSHKLVSEPVLRTEMVYEYSWDTVGEVWVLKNTVKYTYEFGDEETQEIITSDYVTGIPSGRVIYRYTTNKILVEALYQDWVEGEWVNNRRDTWLQDSEGLNSETVIQYFLNGVWTNISRYTDYQYEGRRLTQYTFQSWGGTDWVDSFHDSWYYDENGQLILRMQIRLNDTPINKFTYEIGEDNLRERMTIYNWSQNEWTGFTRRNYEYNGCGMTSAVEYQNFRNAEWVNTMRHEYVYSMQPLEFDRRAKVAICHKGHTIYVALPAVAAHLAHGDCLGKCLVEERGPFADSFFERTTSKSAPFTVYPIPARESVTVRLNMDSLRMFERIELSDYSGNLLRTIKVNDDHEIVIPRGNLTSGLYYLRLQGEETYSHVIIFR